MPNIIEMEGQFLFNKGGDMFYVSKTIDDRLPQHVREHVARWLPNQAVTWRHQSPRKPEYAHQPIYGRIVAAKAYSSGIASIVQLYGNSVIPAFQVKRQALQTLVRKTVEQHEPIGLSLVYDDIKIDNVSAEAEPLEVGVTRRPDCVTCVIKSGVKMVENEKPKVDEAVKQKVEQALETATIEELQGILESKVTELEAEKEAKNEITKKFQTELEAKGKALDELEKKFNKLTTELETAKREPYIKELKANDKFSFYTDKMITSLEIADIVDATNKLKKANATQAQVQVTSLETSVAKVQEPGKTEVKPKKIEELESVEELAKVMDIETDYGKHLVAKINAKKKA